MLRTAQRLIRKPMYLSLVSVHENIPTHVEVHMTAWVYECLCVCVGVYACA